MVLLVLLDLRLDGAWLYLVEHQANDRTRQHTTITVIRLLARSRSHSALRLDDFTSFFPRVRTRPQSLSIVL